MRKLLFPFLLFSFYLFHFQAMAQEPSGTYKKAIFIEGFGQGLQASLNYDMRLKKGEQDGIGIRLGIGGIFAGSSDAGAGPVAEGVVAFPFGLNYLIGQSRSALEAGLGLLPLYSKADLFSPTRPKIVVNNGWDVSSYLNFGYRFQPVNNGLLFRNGWTPVINSSGFISRFGISAGFGFK